MDPLDVFPLSYGLAEQVPACQAAHERASRNAEYGVHWEEWLAVNESDVVNMVLAWWKTVPLPRRLELCAAEKQRLETQLAEVDSYITLLNSQPTE